MDSWKPLMYVAQLDQREYRTKERSRQARCNPTHVVAKEIGIDIIDQISDLSLSPRKMRNFAHKVLNI